MSFYDTGSVVFGPPQVPGYPWPGQSTTFSLSVPTTAAPKSVAEMKAVAYELALKDMTPNQPVEAVIARADAIFAWMFPSARPKPSSDRMAVGE
jgi:hypothetical protein